MAIELARIQLNRVHKIATVEQAALVHHRVPGMLGNIVQNLGRDSVRLQIEGIFYGATAKDDLEALRKVYKQREPVDFLAEVVGQAYFSQVTLERFEVAQLAHYPDQFSYSLTIAEYVEPPQPATTAADTAAVNAAIKLEAQNFINAATLPEALTPGSIPNLTNPVAPLQGALSPITDATKNLQTATAGLGALFEDVELPTPPDLPTNVGVPVVKPLDWQPPTSAPPPLGTLVEEEISGESPGEEHPGEESPGEEHPGEEHPEEEETPTNWAIFALVDEEGNPVAGVRYVVTLGDSIIQQGELNPEGQVRLENIELGTYAITFPEIDEREWEVRDAIAPTPSEEEETATNSAIFALVDEDGNPVGGVSYILTLPDNTTRSGELNQLGQVRLENIELGTYTITFPELDASEWQVIDANAPAPSEEEETPTISAIFALVDEDGNPVGGVRYVVTLGDSIIQQGELNQEGQVRLENVEKGTYTLTFPDLDVSEWEIF